MEPLAGVHTNTNAATEPQLSPLNTRTISPPPLLAPFDPQVTPFPGRSSSLSGRRRTGRHPSSRSAPKSAHTGELIGWWKDPDGLVRLERVCAWRLG